MSNIGVVTVWQVEWIDPPHHDKYYRCYALPNGVEIREYAARGAQKPQFQVLDRGSRQRAEAEAQKQIGAKWKKGYQSSGERSDTFQFDMDKWRGDPMVVRNVANASMVFADLPTPSKPAKPGKPAPAPVSSDGGGSTPVQVNVLDEFAARAQAAITMSVSNESAAMVEYAKLQDEWGDLEESVAKAQSYMATLEALVTK